MMLEKWYTERVQIPGHEKPVTLRGDTPLTLRNNLLALAQRAQEAADRVKREAPGDFS